MPVGLVKARRAHSMPSRFVLPSADMGEYEDNNGPTRRRSAPSRGKLYPLREEGRYGNLPRDPPPPPPAYKGRDKKPKIYSSYAVDNGCAIHSKKLAKAENDHGTEHIAKRRPSWANRTSASPARKTSSSRGSSERTSTSPEPMDNGYHIVVQQKQKPVRKNSGRIPGQFSNRTSSNKIVSSHHRYSSSSGYKFNDLRDSSFEENEEYEYEKNQRRNNNGFGNNYDEDIIDRMNRVSLTGMRKPKINSWDSMGILGLSSKMWSDTKKRQESFMASTGHFLREEDNYGSYIM